MVQVTIAAVPSILRALRTIACSVSLLVGTVAVLAAQEHSREGAFVGFGLGLGTMGCSTCDAGRETGLSGYLKLGRATNQQWLFGVELSFWTSGYEAATQGNFLATAYHYPSPDSGFFLRGGIGLADLDQVPGREFDDPNGLGLSLGLGVDGRRVEENRSLSPYLNFSRGMFDGMTSNVFEIGMGLTWH